MKKPSKTTATVTDEQLRDLIEEAAAAGDGAQVDLCHAALRGNRKARRMCAETIHNAQAMAD